MNQLKRLVLQIFLWLGIWCFLWIAGGSDLKFIVINSPAFLFQVVLLLGLIYYMVPKFLFKKKHLLFSIISISAIAIGAYISSEISPPPPMRRPPIVPLGELPVKTPTRFFIHVLMMAISYVLATLLETFVFAQKKEQGIALAKAALAESELKFLKMQINPHFLFNALNNIYALSVIDSDKTQESISILSDMLRYVIYDCERPKVSLRKELDYIKNYIELFKLRSSKSFDISFTEEVEDDLMNVAPMLFVPFIENAFKHSGVEKGGESFVRISLIQKEGSIDFLVENSIPISPNSTDTHGGIGLPNVQKRLEIVYPDAHKINISKSDTFTVTLKLDTQ